MTQPSQAEYHALVHQHLDMVHTIAGHLRKRYRLDIDMDELVSYGLMGLVEAARRFDPNKGYRFKTFAYRRVSGSIIDGLGELGPLPRPRVRHTRPVRGSEKGDSVPCRSEPVDERLIRAQSVTTLRRVLADLPPRSRRIIERRYWDTCSLVEIGKELGVSKSRACRLHSQALRTLKDRLAEAA